MSDCKKVGLIALEKGVTRTYRFFCHPASNLPQYVVVFEGPRQQEGRQRLEIVESDEPTDQQINTVAYTYLESSSVGRRP